MEKRFIEAVDMLQIAAQHAYCAEHLLKQNAEVLVTHLDVEVDALLPISTLMYMAFELTLKAFILYDHKQVRHFKTLVELIELNPGLNLSKQEHQLISRLSKQQSFRKGVDYLLFENRQQQHVFCEQILQLYARLQEHIPLELQFDYQH